MNRRSFFGLLIAPLLPIPTVPAYRQSQVSALLEARATHPFWQNQRPEGYGPDFAEALCLREMERQFSLCR